MALMAFEKRADLLNRTGGQCPNGCEATLIERQGGIWCPRCKGWLRDDTREGRPHPYISSVFR